ncbi:regulator of chromosome condensation 1/beta-lactamase-inhibitor protein II [Vararia minispora EC-137]|uniref:Regulator of chromosome condensation 1/beta-lactamase-inhibitor protein II n=1 Tax=Vararia minispora EC-137 TaxID=1314806 RepID=A0ACB8QJH0_9AGAM|nr:regulator of chromosome condensation 1/beta-lactamase-inhibitor protein II [Vararia minispora EC-137]
MPIFLFAAGSNARGQLATGTRNDAPAFAPCHFVDIPADANAVLRVAGGANHTLVLLTRGGRRELWGCGDGTRRQLGEALEETTVFCPMHIAHPGGEGWVVKDAAAAWETTYVVTTDGTHDSVLAMGGGDHGALGAQGAVASQAAHVVDVASAVGDTRFVVEGIAAGPRHVMLRVRTSMGHQMLVGWGAGRHGQLGTPHRAVVHTPRSVAADDEGDVASIALGSQHSVFLRSSGKTVVCGTDRVAQTRGLDALESVRSVGCTWGGTYALRADGALFAAGKNDRGQLGRPGAGDAAPAGLVAFPRALGGRRITRLVCGSEHVLVLIEGEGEAEVWGWGWNEHGNLGVGHTDDVLVPQKVWPSNDAQKHWRPVDIWAGCGTSFIAVQDAED